jgi:hypothetical protein
MITQHDEIALSAQVQGGKVKYYKEYALKGRLIGVECISYAEFVRLLDQHEKNKNNEFTAASH